MGKNLSEWWMEKLNRSAFFFIAVLLHLVIFMMVATWVIFQPPIITTPDFDKVFTPPSRPPPPPPQTQTVSVAVPTVTVPVTAAPITSNTSMPTFTVPLNIAATPDPTQNAKPRVTITPPSVNNLASRLAGIGKTVSSWRDPNNIRNSGGDVHSLVAKFPVYLAQYADGDWSCNNYNNLTAGCLPDLVSMMAEWSHKSLVADTIKSIAIDSPELVSHPPPFIFFTGHKDFKLTDAEIDNLRKYLAAGGAVWGDSAFAGDGSRFDVAFHREMKRVLPDDDKKFEPLPPDHDIYTKSWFQISKIPTGMNYRADPIEIINMDGKLAVIYTPNDYSDMMTMAFVPDTDPPQMERSDRPKPNHPLYTQYEFFRSQNFFFRNYQPESVIPVYQLSMNIIAHLLIRFDDALQLAPP